MAAFLPLVPQLFRGPAGAQGDRQWTESAPCDRGHSRTNEGTPEAPITARNFLSNECSGQFAQHVPIPSELHLREQRRIACRRFRATVGILHQVWVANPANFFPFNALFEEFFAVFGDWHAP
jgi:hypothetical protein